MRITNVCSESKGEVQMKETMIQQVMTEPGKITFREIPIPKPGPDQVLVKIKKIGVCGSDIHVFHGTHPYTSYPVTHMKFPVRSLPPESM